MKGHLRLGTFGAERYSSLKLNAPLMSGWGLIVNGFEGIVKVDIRNG